MTYSAEMTPTATSELHAAFSYIHKQAPINPERWLKGVYAAILSLNEFSTRCGFASESKYLGEDIRNFLFKSHRIIFIVDGPAHIVRVLHVRHGSMRAVGEPEGDT